MFCADAVARVSEHMVCPQTMLLSAVAKAGTIPFSSGVAMAMQPVNTLIRQVSPS